MERAIIHGSPNPTTNLPPQRHDGFGMRRYFSETEIRRQCTKSIFFAKKYSKEWTPTEGGEMYRAMPYGGSIERCVQQRMAQQRRSKFLEDHPEIYDQTERLCREETGYKPMPFRMRRGRPAPEEIYKIRKHKAYRACIDTKIDQKIGEQENGVEPMERAAEIPECKGITIGKNCFKWQTLIMVALIIIIIYVGFLRKQKK